MFMFWPVCLSVRLSVNFKLANNSIHIRYNTHIWYMYSSVQSHSGGKRRSSCDLDLTEARPISRVPLFYDAAAISGVLRSYYVVSVGTPPGPFRQASERCFWTKLPSYSEYTSTVFGAPWSCYGDYLRNFPIVFHRTSPDVFQVMLLWLLSWSPNILLRLTPESHVQPYSDVICNCALKDSRGQMMYEAGKILDRPQSGNPTDMNI